MSWVHIVCHECTQESWAVFRRTDPWVLVMFTKCPLYLYKISRSIACNNFAYLCMYDVIVTDWDRGVQARWTPEPVHGRGCLSSLNPRSKSVTDLHSSDIVYNKYIIYYYIMILFKQFYWLSCYLLKVCYST